jgi:hypothetical protein
VEIEVPTPLESDPTGKGKRPLSRPDGDYWKGSSKRQAVVGGSGDVSVAPAHDPNAPLPSKVAFQRRFRPLRLFPEVEDHSDFEESLPDLGHAPSPAAVISSDAVISPAAVISSDAVISPADVISRTADREEHSKSAGFGDKLIDQQSDIFSKVMSLHFTYLKKDPKQKVQNLNSYRVKTKASKRNQSFRLLFSF